MSHLISSECSQCPHSQLRPMARISFLKPATSLQNGQRKRFLQYLALTGDRLLAEGGTHSNPCGLVVLKCPSFGRGQAQSPGCLSSGFLRKRGEVVDTVACFDAVLQRPLKSPSLQSQDLREHKSASLDHSCDSLLQNSMCTDTPVGPQVFSSTATCLH